MRLQDININPKTNKLEIDIMEKNNSFAIVVCEGKLELQSFPITGRQRLSHIRER